jgi:nucleoside triphosphate diphosphatase
VTPDPTPSPLFDRALDLVRFLRARCEWDAKQTPESLLPYLLEEAHEVADAVALHRDDHLAGELGDLLLNLAFQTVLAEERASFSAADVIARIETKMRRRHPHLYGDGPREPWEQIKARERALEGDDAAPASLLDGIPRGLEPLSRAQRIQDRVSAVGFDWRDPRDAIAKVREEIDELEEAVGKGDARAIEEEAGDLLFSVVNVARLVDVHAMTALRKGNEKFARRFRALEALARERAIDLDAASLEEMDVLWDEIKRRESVPSPSPSP